MEWKLLLKVLGRRALGLQALVALHIWVFRVFGGSGLSGFEFRDSGFHAFELRSLP